MTSLLTRTTLRPLSLGTRTSHSLRRSFATHASSIPLVNSSGGPPQTYIEKIVQGHVANADGAEGGAKKKVRAGDYVMIKPDYVMTHDNTAPVISKFRQISPSLPPLNPSQMVFCLDHDVQNRSSKNLQKYSNIENFAHQHGVEFFGAGRGIGHQIVVEEGFAWPGGMTVASDSHSNMYGGVGCLGTPIVRTDAASIWATSLTWFQIPSIIRVSLRGKLRPGVTGKDIIIALCGYFNKDEVLNCAIEFDGEGVDGLSVEERLVVANMTTEWGALAGVFPVDSILLSWYDRLVSRMDLSGFAPSSTSLPKPSFSHPRLNHARLQQLRSNPPPLADEGATYAKHLELDLDTLVPHVSGPNTVKTSTPLTELEEKKIKLDKAYLVSCTNSRASDLAAAASVIRSSPSKRIAPHVEFYIAAASSVVQSDAEKSGDWGTLVSAGAKVLPAGCGPCIGLGVGLLEDGEVGISATNRNYKGRMGSPKAQAWLASPEVVTASALEGFITGTGLSPPENSAPTFREAGGEASTSASTSQSTELEGEGESEALLSGFPETFEGPLVFAPQDNLNTDGIYPGKYTYQDDITREKQGEVVMENYDPEFSGLVKKLRGLRSSLSSDSTSTKRRRRDGKGVILASGYNFGTGSSREQAATALLSSGIPLVLCGSFGDIFKRNSINNALVCLESPSLITDLTNLFGKDSVRGKGTNPLTNPPGGTELTVNTGWWIEVDSRLGRIRIWEGGEKERGKERVYWMSGGKGVGRSVQEIWTAGEEGGLEAWVREKMEKEASGTDREESSRKANV